MMGVNLGGRDHSFMDNGYQVNPKLVVLVLDTQREWEKVRAFYLYILPESSFSSISSACKGFWNCKQSISCLLAQSLSVTVTENALDFAFGEEHFICTTLFPACFFFFYAHEFNYCLPSHKESKYHY